MEVVTENKRLNSVLQINQIIPIQSVMMWKTNLNSCSALDFYTVNIFTEAYIYMYK